MAKPEKQPEISDWRTRIDELDLDLVRMLNERARCAIEIGRIKRKRKMPIYDPAREEEIIRMVVEHNRGPLDSEGIRRLFERIIDESRRIERVTADSTTRTQRHQDSE
jgi:chorismate mutase